MAPDKAMTQAETAALYVDTLSAWAECAARVDAIIVYYKTLSEGSEK